MDFVALLGVLSNFQLYALTPWGHVPSSPLVMFPLSATTDPLNVTVYNTGTTRTASSPVLRLYLTTAFTVMPPPTLQATLFVGGVVTGVKATVQPSSIASIGVQSTDGTGTATVLPGQAMQVVLSTTSVVTLVGHVEFTFTLT